jgi:hypothetical protein
MNWRLPALLAFCLSALLSHAAEARIFKVLPFYLDAQGRNALSPSLYERDAYQAVLRKKPALRQALRVDVQWKAARVLKDLEIRLELRGNQSGTARTTVVKEKVSGTGWFSQWRSVRLEGEEFKKMGDLLAWRVTIWSGDRQLSEQKSFLW